MLQAIRSLFHSNASGELIAKARYAELVARARTPELYTDFAIPDTLDGRFEAIVLMLFVEQMRTETSGASDEDELRLLHEAFFEDMDRNLREGGIGDTGISKRVKKMASALYGRLSNYQDAWGDEPQLKEALKRNVYGTCDSDVDPAALNGLIGFLKKEIGQ